MIYLRAESEVESIDVSVSVCDGFVSRLLGALPAGGIPEDRALLFPDCRQVHTWFMRRSISVLTFDERGRVLHYHSEIPPFCIMPHEGEGRGLLELAPHRLEGPAERLEGEVLHLRLAPPLARRAGLRALEHGGARPSSPPDGSGNDRP